MTESTQPTPAETTVETELVKQSRWQSFQSKHPRAAKATAITAVVMAAVGVRQTVKTVQANRPHVRSARENLAEAGQDLAAAVTPQSPQDN